MITSFNTNLYEKRPVALPQKIAGSGKAAESSKIELPPKRGLLFRMLKHPWCNPYNRLTVFVTIVNLFLLASAQGMNDLMNQVVANFALANLMRQQDMINILFTIATNVPKSFPLSIRWAAGKVYHFGGIHVGAFFSGTLAFAFFAIELVKTSPSLRPSGLIALVAIHLAILLAMIVMALPQIRAKHHDLFERVARFGGWISLALFWTQTILIANHQGASFLTLAQTPTFITLCLITFGVALPWLRMRRVAVRYVRPSSHVVLAEFDYGVTPFAGSSTDLSRNPLLEWHSFANVPSPDRSGFRLTISRAGDWTGKLIDDRPEKIWVKGKPAAGVGNIESIFKKVIWVATGSGIGPCLPHLLANKVPSRLVWSTRNPERTYGKELVDEIRAVQPDAVIWDTDEKGKPDLVQLAYEQFADFGAEAIICISNKKVTWHVVGEFESRGIPAFGAIWDS